MTISPLMRGAALSGLFAFAAPLQAQTFTEPSTNNEEVLEDDQAFEIFAAEHDALEDEAEAVASQQLTLAARSDTGDAGFGPVPSQIQVQSGIKGETVRLTLGTSLSDWEDFNETNFAVTFTAPFNKDDERGNFITQTGLPDAYSIEASFSGSFSAPSRPTGLWEANQAAFVYLAGDARMACRDHNFNLYRESNPESDPNLAVHDAVSKCSAQSTAAMVKKYGDNALKAKLDQIQTAITSAMAEQEYFGWQLSGSAGRQSFDHRDPVTLAVIEQDNTVYSFSGSFTYVPSLDQPFSYIAGVEFEREYKLPKKETRCPADAMGNPTVTCFNAAYGPPTRESDSTIFGAIRYTDLGTGLPIGGELRLAINPDNGEWGAEMPIYFLRGADGALNGGIRVAYDSEEDDVFVGVFVGNSFPSLIN